MSPRRFRTFSVSDSALFRQRAFQWAVQFEHVHFFHGFEAPEQPYPFGSFPMRLAAGSAAEFRVRALGDTFTGLQAFHAQHRDWLVGCLSYDLKNEIERLTSVREDHLGFPLAWFYQPVHLIDFAEGSVTIGSLHNPEAIFQAIMVTPVAFPGTQWPTLPAIQPRVLRSDYLRTVEAIRAHILAGDVYELNYCLEFFAERAAIDPWQTYERLRGISPTPFSVFQRLGPHYLLGASPERFLKKTGDQLVSQPIKGTIRRGVDAAEDGALKEQLRNDEKERAENMMIVDLVRNDLARSAITGSVRVEEMFGIYSFRQVHQMISTVSARLRPAVPFTEALRNAFPMGSMTGAPKVRAMELIEQYERTRRGLFSGAVGYVSPEGDFDFNVVIRSLLYHAESQYLSFQVGSAITYDSVPEREYEECLLKAYAMRKALGQE